MKRNKAFTLIELLVVVLIISILAAVAIPQYEIAVEKARAAEGILLTKSIAKANEVYFLANGEWAHSLDDLDISIIGEDASQTYVTSKKTHLFSCRPHSNTATGDGTSALCRRNDLNYYFYCDRNSKKCYCNGQDDSQKKWCQRITGKSEGPYPI